MKNSVANLIYILTMDHKLVAESFSSAELPNTIIYLKAMISDWDRSIKRTWNLRQGCKRLRIKCCTYNCKDSKIVLEIKTAVAVIVLISLKHNGLCGWAISSSQLWKVHNSQFSQFMALTGSCFIVCFESSVENISVYEHICWHNSEIMLV